MWSEHQSMMQVSREAILDARVEFGPVPTWGKAEVQAAPDARKRRSERQERPKGTPCMAVGSWVHSAAVSPPPIHLNRFLIVVCVCVNILAGEWREATAADGKSYYW
jgi:hypothetical protein